MALILPHFKDITMKNQYMTAKIGLSKFGGRFQMAQEYVDRTLVERMKPYIPRDTGEFLSKILTENSSRIGTGEIVTSVPPQGRTLYPGVTKSGKPFNWTNPQTQPRWGTYTYQMNKAEIRRGVLSILATGKKK